MCETDRRYYIAFALKVAIDYDRSLKHKLDHIHVPLFSINCIKRAILNVMFKRNRRVPDYYNIKDALK